MGGGNDSLPPRFDCVCSVRKSRAWLLRVRRSGPTKAPGKDAQATKNVKKKSDGSGAAAVATLVDMMMAAYCGLISY